MNVKQLITLLKTCDQNALVILAKDEEGNGFSPLAGVDDTANYVSDSTYAGEIGLRELTPELIEQGYGEDDVVGGVKAVVLWPTN